jgi:hypothetical protein
MKTIMKRVHGLMGCALVPWLLAGCAGSSSGGSGAGVPPEAPDWVRSGSGVRDGVVYGVGSASGIMNTSLARTTAANRARAEVSRILEVYSASLMKDYQASTTAGDFSASDEEQRVEQAIKTFSAQLLDGAEVREYWLDAAGNTWFAQVALDFERSAEVAAARERMSPGLSNWVQANGASVLESLDADMKSGALAPSSASAGGGAIAGSGAGEGNDARGGPQPAWTEGACDRQEHLCGVGRGPSREAAAAEARAELARIFEANVRAVQESFQGANRTVSAKTGEEWVEVQEVSSHSMVSSDKVVRMSEIVDRWVNDAGTHHALAVIDRAHAADVLRDEIEALDRRILADVQAADATEVPLEKLRALRRAVEASAERGAKNADLRVLIGDGIPPAMPLEDVLARLDEVSSELRFGLAIDGPGADRVQACLEDALTDRGYAVDLADAGGDFDVRIDGEVRAEQQAEIAGDVVVRVELVLRLKDSRKDRVIRTVRGAEKSTRPTFERAVQTGAFRVCRKRVPQMMRDIDAYFGRR